MSKRQNRLNFIYKVLENGKVVDMYRTHSKRRFYNRIRTIKWEKNNSSVYLRVSYGKAISNYGKLEFFYNDGEYDNKKDFMSALEAFTE